MDGSPATRTDDMNLREQLRRSLQGKIVVVGIGNPSRGDDAAGSCVAQKIGGVPGVYVIDAQDVPENHLSQIAAQRPDTIVLIDCVEMKSAPGSVAVLETARIATYWPSTHRAPLGLIVDYLEKITQARILLLAIQPQQTDLFQPISPEVKSVVEAVASVLNDVLDSRRMPTGAQTANTPRAEVTA